jgi:hypothetical protein
VITCRTLVNLLFDYFGKELPTEECELVEEHLAQCSNCNALADSYRKVINLGRQLPPLSAPSDLVRKVLRMSEKEKDEEASCSQRKPRQD